MVGPTPARSGRVDVVLRPPGPGTFLLHATANNADAVNSTAIVVSAEPVALRIVRQPSDVQAGLPISPSVIVAAVDRRGDRVFVDRAASAEWLRRGVSTGDPMEVVALRGGVVEFSNLVQTRAGDGYQLLFVSPGWESAVSDLFEVTPAPPPQLSFGQPPPARVFAGATWPTVTVEVRDSSGTLDTGASRSITVRGSIAGAVQGTLQVGTTSGVATFAGLTAPNPGTFNIVVSSPGLDDLVSDAIVVDARVPGLPYRFVGPGGALPFAANDPSLSADGGKVALFASFPVAANLSNGAWLHDFNTNSTSYQALTDGGAAPDNWVDEGQISGDGLVVAFNTGAQNFFAGRDLNGFSVDPFAREVGAMTPVDYLGWTTTNVQPDISASIDDHSLSHTGRFAAVIGHGRNVPEAPRGQVLYYHDRQSGLTTAISVVGDAALVAPRGSSMTPDGQWVAFGTGSPNVTTGDTNNVADVFLWNATSGIVGNLTAMGNAESVDPVIADDPRFVVFTTSATNLAVPTLVGSTDVVLLDRTTGTFETISVSMTGGAASASRALDTRAPGRFTGSLALAVSGDARYVVFTSAADNLVPQDTNHQFDVFVRDRLHGVTRRVSVGPNGEQGDGAAKKGTISRDGRVIAWASYASNFFAGDANQREDVWVVANPLWP